MALQAVAVGVLVPAGVALMIAVSYSHSASPAIASVMQGARAGGLAVFLGAVVRLIRPQLSEHRWLGSVFAVVAFGVVWLLPANQLSVLLVAGGLGALVLRPAR